MITAQCWLNRQNSSFAQKFQALDWNWVKNSEALRRYFLTLFLLKKYQIQLVPDVLADSVLHEHLSRPNFEQDMLTLLGQKLIHEVGTTEIKSTFTRDLFEEEFGSVDYWEPSDCGIILRV